MENVVALPSIRVVEDGNGRGLNKLLYSRTGARWVLLDIVVGTLACIIGYTLSPYHDTLFSVRDFATYALPFGLMTGFFSKYCDVPIPCRMPSMGKYDLIASSCIAMVITAVSFLLGSYILTAEVFGRYVLFFMVLIGAMGLIIPRFIVHSLIKDQPTTVAIYGAGKVGQELCERLRSSGNFKIAGFLDCEPEQHESNCCSFPVLGNLDSFGPEKLAELGVDVVILCSDDDLHRESVPELLTLPLHGIEILTKGAFVEYYYREVSVTYANPHYFASHRALPGNKPMFAIKRLVDIIGASVGIMLTLPVWPVIALLIKRGSEGPVFFKQQRVGYLGRQFDIYKFRTMGQDAEKDGAQWAVKSDPRVTRIGKFLRLSRLDEIPQLWNVFKGDMSLVGPRPERPEFVKELVEDIPFYERRHLVPPGLTGWAQIRYQYGASKEDALKKLQFDLYYVRNMSPGFDLQIIVKTIPMMMKGSR